MTAMSLFSFFEYLKSFLLEFYSEYVSKVEFLFKRSLQFKFHLVLTCSSSTVETKKISLNSFFKTVYSSMHSFVPSNVGF